jgi:VWFA-related protein
MKPLATVIVASCAAVAIAALAGAQTTRFTSGVDVVRVDTLVTSGGRLVRGLRAADFELRDNGILQEITDVAYESLPLNVIVALDLSGSVAGQPLMHLKDGLQALIGALGSSDRAALVSFSYRLTLHSALTGDRERLRAVVAGLVSGGSTAAIDATFAGLALREADPGRTLLLLFSDGIDTASWLSAKEVIDAARASDVVIYPVTVQRTRYGAHLHTVMPGGTRADDDGRKMLEAFADETGGRVFYADSERTLQKTLGDVLDEFKQRYVLSYTPTNVRSGGWHTLEVKVRGNRGQVTARRGYAADGRSMSPAAAPPKEDP